MENTRHLLPIYLAVSRRRFGLDILRRALSSATRRNQKDHLHALAGLRLGSGTLSRPSVLLPSMANRQATCSATEPLSNHRRKPAAPGRSLSAKRSGPAVPPLLAFVQKQEP